jgi:microcystin-dependent protein
MSVTISGDTGITFPNGSTQAAAVSLPAGVVLHFANSTAPSGWLECNGATVSRATYPALFSAIGTVYGAGDGSTTFKLPDLRGQFLRGWDNGAGVDPGRAIGTSQADAFTSHTHSATSGNFSITGNTQFSYGGAGASLGISATTAATGGTETRPKNIAMLPCIKT